MDDQLRANTHAAGKDDDAALNGKAKRQDVVVSDEEMEEQSYPSSGNHEHVKEEETSGGETDYEYEQSVETRSAGHGMTGGDVTDGEEYRSSRGTSRSCGSTSSGATSSGATDDEEEHSVSRSVSISSQGRGNAAGGEASGGETDYEDEFSVCGRYRSHGNTTDEEINDGERENDDQQCVVGRSQGHRDIIDGTTRGGEAGHEKEHSVGGRTRHRSIGDGMGSGEETETKQVAKVAVVMLPDVMEIRGQQNENNSAQSDNEADVKSKDDGNTTVIEVTGGKLRTVISEIGQQNENNSAQPDNEADGNCESCQNTTVVETTDGEKVETTGEKQETVVIQIEQQNENNLAQPEHEADGGEKVETTGERQGTVVMQIEQQNENNLAQPEYEADGKSHGEGHGAEMTEAELIGVVTESEQHHETHPAQSGHELHDKSPGHGNTIEKHYEDNSPITDHNHDSGKQHLPYMDELKEYFVTEHIGSANQIVITVEGESGEHAILEIDQAHELKSHEVHEEIGNVLNQAEQRRKLLEDLIIQQDELSDSIHNMEAQLVVHVDMRVPVMRYKPLFSPMPKAVFGHCCRTRPKTPPIVVHEHHETHEAIDQEALNWTPYDPYTEGPYAIKPVVVAEEVPHPESPKSEAMHDDMYGWIKERKKSNLKVQPKPVIRKAAKKTGDGHDQKEKHHPPAPPEPVHEPMPDQRHSLMYGWMLPGYNPNPDKDPKKKKKSAKDRGHGDGDAKHKSDAKKSEHAALPITIYGWAINAPVHHVAEPQGKRHHQTIIFKERAPPPRHCWREEPPKPDELAEFCNRKVGIPKLTSDRIQLRRCSGRVKCPPVRPLRTFREKPDTCLPRKR